MTAFSVTESLINHISTFGYHASSRVPKGHADTFVTVERTGGGASSFIDHPVMAVQVWAHSEDEAERAANELRNALLTSPPPQGIHSIRLETGPYPFFDDSTGSARYQMVLDITCQLTIKEN